MVKNNKSTKTINKLYWAYAPGNPEDATCPKCGFVVDTTTAYDFEEYHFCPCCGVALDRFIYLGGI